MAQLRKMGAGAGHRKFLYDEQTNLADGPVIMANWPDGKYNLADFLIFLNQGLAQTAENSMPYP